LPAGTSVSDGRVTIATATPTAVLHAVTGWAVEHGVELPGVTVHRPTLEDVYLSLSEGEQ
jgi:ABC-2 type transport system ATP-binding protein